MKKILICLSIFFASFLMLLAHEKTTNSKSEKQPELTATNEDRIISSIRQDVSGISAYFGKNSNTEFLMILGRKIPYTLDYTGYFESNKPVIGFKPIYKKLSCIKLTIPKVGISSILIYDHEGSLAGYASINANNIGKYRLHADFSNLPDGEYYLILETESDTVSTNFVL